jgi:autonomous glycyl radical cofactor GrcA
MVSIDFEATAQTGTIPPNFADMTKLREVWFSYGQSSLFSGVLPNFNSLNMKEFSIYSTNTLIGVFPDITNMSEFSWCQSKPSNLCRDPAVNVAVYEALGGECDAASLPICTDEDMTAIAAAQIEAADIQVKYNTARVEKKRFNALTPEEQAAEIAALSEAARFDALTSEEQAAEVAEAARFDALTPEEQAAEVAETARFNALTPEEQAAEIAALSEAARFDALTSEEQAAEVAEAARFDALTPEEQAAEVAETARFNALTPEEQAAEIAALSEAARFDALTSEEQAAEVAEAARFDALTPEEQADEVAETARFNALTPEEQAVEIAALSLSSAGLSSFAAPGILSVLLLALAIV